MRYRDHRWFIPSPELESEFFEVHRTTHQFYQEAQSREEHDCYCQWYQAAVKQHRQELEKMRCDINLFGWFCRKS